MFSFSLGKSKKKQNLMSGNKGDGPRYFSFITVRVATSSQRVRRAMLRFRLEVFDWLPIVKVAP